MCTENDEKHGLESAPAKKWKSRRTSADKVSLKPQKVCFRARGSAIRQNPINLKKAAKSLPKDT